MIFYQKILVSARLCQIIILHSKHIADRRRELGIEWAEYVKRLDCHKHYIRHDMKIIILLRREKVEKEIRRNKKILSHTIHHIHHQNHFMSFFRLLWAVWKAVSHIRYFSRFPDERRCKMWEEKDIDPQTWKRSISSFQNTKNYCITPPQCEDIHL